MEDSYRFFDVDRGDWARICGEADAAKIDAPFYLFDEKRAKENLVAIRRCLGGQTELAYAMKANPWLARTLESDADFIEVCSAGELEICRTQGICGKRVMLDGVWRDEALVRRALDMGVRRFGIDSVRQMEQLILASGGRQGPVCALLRVSSGNQLGMEREDVAACIRLGREAPNLRMAGIQYYPGTHRTDARSVRRDLERLAAWISWCASVPGFQLREIEFGAGIGVPYFEGEDMADYIGAMEAAARFVREAGRTYRVIYEAGRIAAASCGVYVTEVFEEKRRGAQKVLLCLGGMNHLRYHGGALGVRTPKIHGVCAQPSGVCGSVKICGASCSESDVLARECRSLDQNVTVGSRIIFCGAGAYAATESANLFLGLEIPRVLLYNQDNAQNQALRCVRGSLPAHLLFYTAEGDGPARAAAKN